MSETSPAISLLMPFYNPYARFKDSIHSILNQTFNDFELILINNNSDKTSTQIALEISKRENRVRYLEEKQQGVVFATKTGINAAKGNFISRMDADDIALPDKLGKQHEFLQLHPNIDLLGCKVKYVSHKIGGLGFQHYVDWSNSLCDHDSIYLNRFIESPMINPSIMFRKELLKKHELYREGDFPEDYELFLRWLQEGVKMAKLPEVLLEWHDGADRLTRTDQRYSVDAFFRIKSHYLFEELKKINPSHPKVVIWGAGRVTRKRLSFLKELGLDVEYYIDVKEKHGLDAPCISFNDLPSPGNSFILSLVTNRGAREQIEEMLIEKGYQAGLNYLMMG